MEDPYPPRLFEQESEIRRIGEAFCACTLARAEWTHEAHLATCLWVLVERPDIRAERELGPMIRRFNESVGGVNDETQGYHETITLCSIASVRSYLARRGEGHALLDLVNALLEAPEGRRDWLLQYYSKERLFSVEARLGWLEPDLAPLPGIV